MLYGEWVNWDFFAKGISSVVQTLWLTLLHALPANFKALPFIYCKDDLYETYSDERSACCEYPLKKLALYLEKYVRERRFSVQTVHTKWHEMMKSF
mgnify:CR=1 FL=1